MIFWDGGIGEPTLSSACHSFDVFCSQIFPNFAPVNPTAIQHSVLANIRAKRAAVKVAQTG